MDFHSWAEISIDKLRRLKAAAEGAKSAIGDQSVSSTVLSGAQHVAIDPRALTQAIADFCRGDNATTQALAIRLANLAAKYPTRAA